VRPRRPPRAEHAPEAYRADGEYDTYIARGRVLAEGLAYTLPTSRIVEDDLKKIASDIAG
jgi:hypothetical protein